MDQYLGEIRTFAFGQVPRGWLACSGQVVAINQNQALFSLLGTQFGGNGITTFNLPNLNGAAMLGYSSSNPMGAASGTESVTLTTPQLPAHNHNVQVVNALGTQALNNSDDYLAQICVFVTNPQSANYAVNGYAVTLSAPVVLSLASVSPTGGNTPHENRGPFLTMNVCISTTGIFPSRS